MERPNVRVVYVVGCTHSGSTLLTRILNQHSRIFSAGELQYLDRCWGPTGRPCACGEHPVRCPVWGEVFWKLAATDLDLAPVSRFAIGTPDYPDRAATLVVVTDRLDDAGATLRGPGIDGAARLSLPEIAAFRANRALFPLGFDTLLTCGDRLAGLPRSTRVEAA